MTLRMGKAGALFLWVRNKLSLSPPRSYIMPSTDICLLHGFLRLPNCSSGVL